MPTVFVPILVGLVALVHVALCGAEIFLWTQPLIHERLDFTYIEALKVAPIVANAGLYNGFIAAGLMWGLFAPKNATALRLFFLTCVAIAGIFGAVTLKPTTLILQTLPSVLAIMVVLWAIKAKLKY